MIFVNMLAVANQIYNDQHGPTKQQYDLVGMVLFFVAIFFAILAIVAIVKRYFAMKVKREKTCDCTGDGGEEQREDRSFKQR